MADSLFRAMEPDADDGPKVGEKRNMLGARPDVDMKKGPRAPDGTRVAGPGRGGPSVSVNDWSHMHVTVRPKAFGGHNSLNRMYVAPGSALEPARLALGTIDAVTKHSVIEAAEECSFEVFQVRIASMRPSWTFAPPPVRPVKGRRR